MSEPIDDLDRRGFEAMSLAMMCGAAVAAGAAAVSARAEYEKSVMEMEQMRRRSDEYRKVLGRLKRSGDVVFG